MNEPLLVTIAPMMSDPRALVIYRESGEEIIVKINQENKASISCNQRLTIDEVNFIRKNYLQNESE
jgi:hypothetical protein